MRVVQGPIQYGCFHLCLQIYHKDVTERLREKRLESDTDFEWLKILRLYLEVCGVCKGSMPSFASI